MSLITYFYILFFIHVTWIECFACRRSTIHIQNYDGPIIVNPPCTECCENQCPKVYHTGNKERECCCVSQIAPMCTAPQISCWQGTTCCGTCGANNCGTVQYMKPCYGQPVTVCPQMCTPFSQPAAYYACYPQSESCRSQQCCIY